MGEGSGEKGRENVVSLTCHSLPPLFSHLNEKHAKKLHTMQTKATQDLFQKYQFLFIYFYFYMSAFLQMALMHNYIRRANFTTKLLVFKQNSLHLHSLCMSVLFKCTALEIH